MDHYVMYELVQILHHHCLIINVELIQVVALEILLLGYCCYGLKTKASDECDDTCCDF